MPDTGRSLRSGVTIIELLMVMALVGILMAVALPRINVTGYKSDAAARQVRGALQVAQRSAITRQGNIIISFDSANRRVMVVEDNNDNELADAGERLSNIPLEDGTQFAIPPMGRIVGGSSSSVVEGSALKTIGNLPSIVMRRDGSASSDAEIYLTVRTAVTTEYRGILVDPSIGKAEIYRYNGTAWVRSN